MTYRVFDDMFKHLIGVEGKFQCQYEDKGNWTGGKVGVGQLKGTKYGVSAAAYPNLDIKNITLQQAKQIFYKDYWLKVKANDVADCMSILLVDMAYHSGPINAIKVMQTTVGTVVDGLIGPKTINAINAQTNISTINRFRENRMKFLMKTSGWAIYGNGWTNRVNSITDYAKTKL